MKHLVLYRTTTCCVVWIIVAVAMLTLYNLTPRVVSYDTPFYVEAGERLLHGQIDCLRTPVYPLLLQLCRVLAGQEGMFTAMTILQSIVYLFSVVAFLRVVQRLVHHKILQWLAVLAYTVIVAPGWCNAMLTESLSMSGCIIMVYLTLCWIDKPSVGLSMAVTVMTLLLVFLRPSFVFLIVVVPFVAVLLIIKEKRISGKRSLVFLSSVLAGVCLLLYCHAYQSQYGVFGFSISSTANKIYDLKRSGCWNHEVVSSDRGRELCMALEEDGGYSVLYNTVSDDREALPLIQEADKEMQTACGTGYLKYRMAVLKGSMAMPFFATFNTHTPLAAALHTLNALLAFPLNWFYLIILANGVLLLFNFLKHRNVPVDLLFVYCVVLAQCVGIVLCASEAHNRLMIPVWPAFLAMTVWGLEWFCHRVVYDKEKETEP